MPRSLKTARRFTVALLAAGLTAAVLPTTPAFAAPANLVKNPDFSNASTGWKVNASTATLSTTSISGNPAALIRATKAGNTVALNDATNTVTNGAAGVEYTATARVRATTADTKGQLRVREVGGGSSISHAAGYTVSSANTWQTVKLNFTTTKAANALDVNVVAWNVGTGQNIIVDAVTLTSGQETVTPPPVQTPGYTLSDGCRLDLRGLGDCAPLVGAAHGSNTDPSAFEASLGQRFGVRRTYYQGTQVSKAVSVSKTDLAAGRIPWISFKLPYSWTDMANGKGDAWAKDLVKQLDALEGPVWLAFHHEPEKDGDIKEWKRMQERLGPIVRSGSDNVAFSVVLTGWNQWYGPAEYRIENMWPNTKVDVAGFDIYSFYATTSNGVTKYPEASLKSKYFDKISAWAKTKDVEWGLAETGVSDPGALDYPNWISTTSQELQDTGAIAMSYFDSHLNLKQSYNLTTAAKKADFGRALKASPTFPKQ